jgi:predicted nucleic acid-binding protein
MAAVAVRAAFIVTYDSDLLALQKPHGVACVTPRAFLSAILRRP